MSADYRFGPLERRGIFLGVRGGQLVVGLVATAVVVATFSLWPSPLGGAIALCVVAIGGAMALVPVAGRTPEEWLPIIARFAVDGFLGSHRWVGPSNLRGHLLVGGPVPNVADPQAPSSPPRRRPSAHAQEVDGPAEQWVQAVTRLDAGDVQPPFLRGLQMLGVRWRSGEVGVIKDVSRRTYVGVLVAGGRSFALLDQGEKERLLMQWGSVLSGVVSEGGCVTRMQWLERAIPDDSEAVVRHLREHRALPASSPFVTSFLELIDETGPQTQQHEVYIALQVSAARASRAIRQLRRGVDLGSCEVLSRELHALAANLRRAEVEVRGILSPRMLAAAIRHAVDPPSRYSLANRTAADVEVVGASPRNAFPRRTHTTWSTLVTEGAHHATYWVAEWPRTAVGSDWMAPLLLGTRCRRTASVVMEPSPPALALRRVEAARVDDATTQSFRERFGFRTTVRKQREEENSARAEEELNEGHAHFTLSAYVTVTATSREELAAACSDVEQQASRARLDLRREHGSQDVAFTYTLPLCRGLR